MVAINEKAPSGSPQPSPAGTQPLVDNLYQGMTLDSVTGLYYARNRNYSPSLGRWINQDPAGYINGANTYQFVGSNPVGNVDPDGTQAYGVHPYVQPSTGGGSPFLIGWGDAIIKGGVYGAGVGAAGVALTTGPEDVPGMCLAATVGGVGGGVVGLVGYPVVHFLDWGWGKMVK